QDLLDRLAATRRNGDDRARRDLERRAAGLKAVAPWHATSTIQTCRDACGGAGYLSENLLPQLKADTDVFTTFEGDNTVLLQLVTKALLGAHRDHIQSLGMAGVVRLLLRTVGDSAAEWSGARALVQRL